MPYDWDPAKAASNLAKHGVEFASVEGFQWWDRIFVRASLGGPEPRLEASGLIGNRVHVLVFSIETRATRVISLRKANEREVRRWISAT